MSRARWGLALATLLACPLTAHADVATGFVRDPDGNPVFNADFNVYDAETGIKQVYSDKTDVTGKYRLVLPAGRYDLLVRPVLNPAPPLRQLAPTIKRAVVVSGTLNLDFVAPLGTHVRVAVHDSANADPSTGGMAGSTIDYDRTDDGSRQPVLGNLTNAFGLVITVLEPSSYNVAAYPDTASGFAPVRLFDVALPLPNPDADVLDMPVVRGMWLNGTVRDDTGAPVAGAVLKFDDSTGHRIPSSKHESAPDGSIRTDIAPGVYRITVEPRLSGNLAAIRVPDVDMTQTRSMDFVLSRGAVVTGLVTDAHGEPVALAKWSLVLENGNPVATPGDNTGFDGRYRYVVVPGLYKLKLTPPASTGLDSLVMHNVPIARDTTINIDFAALGGGGGNGPVTRFQPRANPTHTRAGIVLVLNKNVASALVEVYDVSGRRVRELHSGPLAAGTNDLAWDGRSSHGAQAHTGVYLVRARLDGHDQVTRFVLLP